MAAAGAVGKGRPERAAQTAFVDSLLKCTPNARLGLIAGLAIVARDTLGHFGTFGDVSTRCVQSVPLLG
jgi:hypothetical protein